MTYLLVAAVTTDLFTDKLTAHTLFGLSQFLSSAQNKTCDEQKNMRATYANWRWEHAPAPVVERRTSTSAPLLRRLIRATAATSVRRTSQQTLVTSSV